MGGKNQKIVLKWLKFLRREQMEILNSWKECNGERRQWQRKNQYLWGICLGKGRQRIGSTLDQPLPVISPQGLWHSVTFLQPAQRMWQAGLFLRWQLSWIHVKRREGGWRGGGMKEGVLRGCVAYSQDFLGEVFPVWETVRAEMKFKFYLK